MFLQIDAQYTAFVPFLTMPYTHGFYFVYLHQNTQKLSPIATANSIKSIFTYQRPSMYNSQGVVQGYNHSNLSWACVGFDYAYVWVLFVSTQDTNLGRLGGAVPLAPRCCGRFRC